MASGHKMSKWVSLPLLPHPILFLKSDCLTDATQTTYVFLLDTLYYSRHYPREQSKEHSPTRGQHVQSSVLPSESIALTQSDTVYTSVFLRKPLGIQRQGRGCLDVDLSPCIR